MTGPVGRAGPVRETPGDERVAADDIELRIPARPEFVRLARLAAADVGSRAGLGYEEVDDLRIAIDELCHAVMGVRDASDGDGRVLDLRFVLREGSLAIEGACTNDRTPELNELSTAILEAVVDERELDRRDGVAAVPNGEASPVPMSGPPDAGFSEYRATRDREPPQPVDRGAPRPGPTAGAPIPEPRSGCR